MTQCKKVFVYGTLREGQGNHRLLRDALRVGKGILNNHLMYSLGGFPYIIHTSAISEVVGEVYDCDDATRASLDCLEGYPGFYDRKTVEVTLEDGEKVEALSYFFHDRWAHDDVPIPDGDWVGFQPIRRKYG